MRACSLQDMMAGRYAAARPLRGDVIPGNYLTTIIDRYADGNALFTGDDGTPVVWLHQWSK